MKSLPVIGLIDRATTPVFDTDIMSFSIGYICNVKTLAKPIVIKIMVDPVTLQVGYTIFYNKLTK